MKKTIICLIFALLFASNSNAGEPLVQSASATAVLQDVNNPESTLPTKEQQESPQSSYFGKKTDRPVSAHKVNYFSLDQWLNKVSDMLVGPASSASQL